MPPDRLGEIAADLGLLSHGAGSRREAPYALRFISGVHMLGSMWRTGEAVAMMCRAAANSETIRALGEDGSAPWTA